MKRFLLFFGTVLLSAAVYAVVAHGAWGRGAIQLREGRAGLFGFHVRQEGHHVGGALEYVDRNERQVFAAVRLPEVVRVQFDRHSVHFGGPGILNDHRVFVAAFAFDGHGTKHRDRFGIRCFNHEGVVVYEAEGELVRGDIVVRHR